MLEGKCELLYRWTLMGDRDVRTSTEWPAWKVLTPQVEVMASSPSLHSVNEGLQLEAPEVKGLHARSHGLPEPVIDLCQHLG